MTADLPRIDVLLATHNGADFLDAQLRIAAGAERSRVSPPGARRRLDRRHSRAAGRVVARWPGKIELIDGGGPRLGACGIFAALLARSEADYVMFCDQDDVWLPEKIARTLGKMIAVERETAADCPLLVHTDLAVVDESLRPLSPSYWRYQHLDVRRGATLNRLLMQNVATGCAAMANRALVRKAAPIPPEAVLHDWWLALVASPSAASSVSTSPRSAIASTGRTRSAPCVGTWAPGPQGVEAMGPRLPGRVPGGRHAAGAGLLGALRPGADSAPAAGGRGLRRPGRVRILPPAVAAGTPRLLSQRPASQSRLVCANLRSASLGLGWALGLGSWVMGL